MTHKVGDLMIPISEVAVIDEESTLFEAVLQIGIARASHPPAGRCPIAFVAGRDRTVTGFLEFGNLLKGLQPGYAEFAEPAKKSGYSTEEVRSELQKHGLWEDALEGLCRKAGESLVKTFVTVPDESRIIAADSTINEAIYRMITTGKDYLCVNDGQALAGVIGLTDILGHICDTVRNCRM